MIKKLLFERFRGKRIAWNLQCEEENWQKMKKEHQMPTQDEELKIERAKFKNGILDIPSKGKQGYI